MMTTNYEILRASVAKGLRHLRGRDKAPLKTVAAALGVSVAALGAWETGARFPSSENLVGLAQYYRVSACQLLNPSCPRL